MRLFGSAAFGRVQEDQAKAQVGDTQHVAGPENTPLDALAVDPGPVGAAQVENEDLAVARGQAAVPTGYPRPFEAYLASRTAADECQRVIETEVGVPVQRNEAREHDHGRQSRRGESQSRGNSQQELVPRAYLRGGLPSKSNLRSGPRWGRGFQKYDAIMGGSAR